MDTKKNNTRKRGLGVTTKLLAAALFTLPASLFMSSCSDFFEQDSEHVIFSDTDHLSGATDSIYSVTGILNKLQALADRTVVFGEVRGDLVDITSVASSDLRDVALFDVKDGNQYNSPRDYYAVINNCNYFIAHADTALRNNRNEYIFMREYAAVKAIRAWTYLQLTLVYGSVPFVTEPILTKAEAEASYPRYDLEAVCQYFIADLVPLSERYGREYPSYGTIRSTDSRLFYFPIDIVLGDLNLWLASLTGNQATYREAALRYYKYISERNGDNSTYPQGLGLQTWRPGDLSWMMRYSWNPTNFGQGGEVYSADGELITMIPCDSIRAEGNYSELRNLFVSREENDYKVSLTPSQSLFDLSESQAHCCLGNSGTTVIYAPAGLPNHRSGDLRLASVYTEGYTRDRVTNERIEIQTISKFSSRNVHIYRRQQVYLRLAEALNQGGFPRAAFQILSQGLNSDVFEADVYPYVSQSDSTWLSQISFPASRYGLFTSEDLVNFSAQANHRTMGIHSRGAGWTPMNEYYQLPDDSLLTEQQKLPLQQAFVDSLLLNENGLEMAFEGTRFYDLMRFSLRQANPGQFLARYVYARRGEANREAMRGEIKKDLTDRRNWYISWNGQIGLE